MKYTTYSRYVPGLLETLNLQALLDQLATSCCNQDLRAVRTHIRSGRVRRGRSDRSLDACASNPPGVDGLGPAHARHAECVARRSTGDAQKDQELQKQLADLLDQIVQKLIDEATQSSAGAQDAGRAATRPRPGGVAKEAAQQVQFNLTDKGIDFLGFRTLKHLLGVSGNRASARTRRSTWRRRRAESASKRYEYGDTLNLDVNATLSHALKREGLGVPINLEYDDLMVHQAEYRSSSATVLMLDCSHSMILYGEDRSRRKESRARADPPDPHAVSRRHAAGGAVSRHCGGDPAGAARARAGGAVSHQHDRRLKLARRILMGQRKDMRQIIMITDGKRPR